MITPRNFCHIETIEDGVQVLFYVEYDGGEVKLHQIVNADIGTIDIKVALPADKWEELWPDKVMFADAAAGVAVTVRDMGFNLDKEPEA